VAKAGAPVQNGVAHVKAGDIRAEEAAGVLKTGDPAGFNLVDVMVRARIGVAFPCAASRAFAGPVPDFARAHAGMGLAGPRCGLRRAGIAERLRPVSARRETADGCNDNIIR
jgi:hypothetical protein